MATVVNTRDVLLLAASPRLLWTGVRGVKITADSTTFKVTAAGSPTPSTINLTSALNGVSGTVNWTVTFGTATLSSSTGATTSLVYSNMTTSVVTIKATVTDGGVAYTDTITLSKVVDGATGATGATGSAGAAGDQGASSRIAYTLIDGNSLNSTPTSVTVSGDSKPSSGTWGETRSWTNSPSSPSAGQAVFQSTGTYNPTTNQTVWVVPYLSNLKVGQLSAITADIGTITAGSLTANVTIVSNGNIKASGQNSNLSSVWGDNPNTNSYGVAGTCNTTGGTGVFGVGTAQGVYGSSPSGKAIYGNTDTGYAVYGISSSSSGVGGYFTAVTGYALQTSGKSLFQEFDAITLTSECSSSSYSSGVFRNTSSGKVISLGGGSYAAYSGSGDGKIYAVDGFTPFTGSHNGLILKRQFPEVGDIVCDVATIFKHDVSNTLSEIACSSVANDKRVIGVFVSEEHDNPLDIPDEEWYNYKEKYSLISFNAVGEGCINVCGENGNIEIGDLIVTSSQSGKGMKQSDDIVRNITVAKSREDVKFDSPTQIKQIACIYMCG